LHTANVVLHMYGVFRDKIKLETPVVVSRRLDDVSEMSSVEGRRHCDVLHCSNPNCRAVKKDYEGVQHVVTLALYKFYVNRTTATSTVTDS
jgi:hypothetical protein